MENTNFDHLTFLPFFRKKFPIQSEEDGGLARRTGALRLQISGKPSEADTGSTQTTSLPITFFGPSDVQGINPSAIARVEPPNGTNDFEPNYFPFIEFRDPDFIWRYSLSNPDDQSSPQQPWLALLVYSKEELQSMGIGGSPAFRQNGDGRWVLDISPDFLPSQKRAEYIDQLTGHTQLHNYDESGILQFIENNPEKNCSRLFCLRKLTKETNYVLFLVPYYLAGATGSDELGDASILDISERTEIPVYHHSYFTTSEEGDFEFLARKLTLIQDPPPLGTKPVDITQNLEEIPDQIPYQDREGALVAPGYSKDREKYFKRVEKQHRTDMLYEEIKKDQRNKPRGIVISDTALEDEKDPFVTLPYYGKHYQKFVLRSKNTWDDLAKKTPLHWSEELNLDIRNRISAGFGTQAIRKHQQKYLKECWLQAGDLHLANEKLLRAQAGVKLSQSIQERFVDFWSDEAFFLVSRSFQSHFAAQKTGRSTSIKTRLNHSGLPKGSIQPALLRMARQRLKTRNLGTFDPWKNVIKDLNEPQRDPRKEWAIPSFLFEPDTEHLRLPQDIFSPMVPPKIEVIPVKPMNLENTRAQFDSKQVIVKKLRGLIQTNDPRKVVQESFDPILISPTIEEAMYRPLKSLSLDYILPGIDKIPQNSILLCEENRYFIESYLCGTNDEMGKELVWNRFPTDQRGTIFSFFWDPTTYEKDVQDDVGNTQKMRDIRPIHLWKEKTLQSTLPFLDRMLRNPGSRSRIPSFPWINRRTLTRLSNAARIPPSVFNKKRSFLSKNPSFVNKDGDKEGRLVLLIKGDLIRRYPDTVIFALKRESTYEESASMYEESEEESASMYEESESDASTEFISPSFRANLAPDIVGIGFPFTLEDIQSSGEYYFVLQEQQDLPRFGFDVETRERRDSSTENVDPVWGSVDLQNPMNYILEFNDVIDGDKHHGAHLASRTLQKPVQIVIHATQILEFEHE